MGDDRSTVELPKPTAAGTAGAYSVKRATTQDDRAQSRLVERVSTPMRLARAGTDPAATSAEAHARWRVEVADDRVVLRAGGVQIELAPDEARRIAETILRAK